MRSPLRSLLAPVAGILLFSGCLTIEENYTFNKEGGGSMEYVVDISELGGMLDGLEALEEKGARGRVRERDTGRTDMKDMAARLRTLTGISKVKVRDKEEYVQRLSFRFKDLNALNGALNVIMPDSTGAPHTFFRWEGGTLVRTNNRHALEVGSDMGVDSAPGDSTDPTALLQRMHYKYSFAFPKSIRDRQVAGGVVQESPDPRKLLLDMDWSVIMRDPAALDLRITLEQ